MNDRDINQNEPENEEDTNPLVTMAIQLKETLQEITRKIDVEGIKKYLYSSSMQKNEIIVCCD